MIQIATTISLAEASCKNDAIDLPEKYKVAKREISTNIKIEGPDGLVANHFATKLEKQLVIFELVLVVLDWSLLKNYSFFHFTRVTLGINSHCKFEKNDLPLLC